MELKGKKFVASYSGGKDSILAIDRAIRAGMVPLCLVITYDSSRGRSWFHGVPQELLSDVSRALNIPLRLIRTSEDDYAERFIDELRLQKERGADVCVFGDIDIQGHLDWCSDVCRQAGIEAYFPLWQEKRGALVREFIARGFTANITIVDTSRLSTGYLGKVLSTGLIEEIATAGADECGENGEYHSFVSDGPIFSHPIRFSFAPMLINGNYASLPVLPAAE